MRTILPLIVLVTVAVLAMLAHAAVTDAHAVKLTIRPLVSFAPSQLAIQVRVQPEADDRWISVWTDSGDFSRLSAFTIEPDRHLYVVTWPRVPAGEFVVQAAIGHGDITRASDRQQVTVQGQ